METGLDGFAATLGLSPSAFVFLISLFSTLPISFLHRFILGTNLRHIYAFSTGALLCFLAYDGVSAFLQVMIPILFSYLVILTNRKHCGTIVLFSSFAFLVYCHAINLSGDTWRKGGVDYTGTLMVITLKVSSVAIDYEDGLLQEDKAGHKMYKNRISQHPKFLEYFGYVFCCGSILVGPLFSFKSYCAFSEKKDVWDPSNKKREPNPILPALQSLAKSVLVLVLYQTMNSFFPGHFMVDPRFLQLSQLSRWLYIIVSGFTMRWMYYFVWSVAECAMILSGLGFTGYNENGKPEWKRAQNMDIAGVELSWSSARLPSYWNMGVAQWLRIYIYDRLSVHFGNAGFRALILTQCVSALWHGLYPGYFLFFLNCAVAQHASKLLYRMVNPDKENLSLFLKCTFFMGQFIFKQMVVNYSIAGFIILKGDETLAVWRSVHFVGTVLPIAVSICLVGLSRKRKTRKQE